MPVAARRPVPRFIIALAAVALAGCQSVVENRVAAGLTDAGLPPRMAECMSEIWAERLSVAQIRRISAFASEVREERSTLTVAGLIARVTEWGDPEALAVVTSSAARCAIG